MPLVGAGDESKADNLTRCGPFVSDSDPQINNKVYGTVTVPRQMSQDAEQVQRLVLESQLGQELLGERSIKRAILSPRTALINFLIDE